jgi:hypothetical protein
MALRVVFLRTWIKQVRSGAQPVAGKRRYFFVHIDIFYCNPFQRTAALWDTNIETNRVWSQRNAIIRRVHMMVHITHELVHSLGMSCSPISEYV